MNLESNAMPVSRRTLLAGAAALGVAGGAALAGCSPGADGGDGAPVSKSKIEALLPTYKVSDVVKADLPGTPDGVPNTYFSFPKTPPATVSGVPGAGGSYSMLTLTWDPIAWKSDGAWVKGLNERLGATLSMTVVPAGDYPSKLATATAGNEMPDIITMSGATRMPDLLRAKFTDLTEYVAGDAILEYPNLANVTSGRWRNCVYNNAVYAVPAQNLIGSPSWYMNQEILDDMGIEFAPKDADEIRAVAKEITAARSNTFAFGTVNNALLNMATAMWDAPNGWGQTDGKFVRDYETDQFRAALDYVGLLWKDGVLHPDSFSPSYNTKSEFTSGRVVIQCDGGTAWVAPAVAGMNLTPWTIPSATGGGLATRRLTGGLVAPIGIKKQSSPEQVKEILRILNWLSAPFGTAEHLYRRYGEEGTHFTWTGTGNAPVLTDQGKAEMEIALTYTCSATYDFFVPGKDAVAKAFYDDQLATLPTGKASAANGLYSETNDSKGVTLNRTVNDVINQVVQGRKTLADFDDAVAAYRAGGGDTIRKEYEESYAALQ